jgi:iron complex outermembrane recepter protein
MNGIKPITRYVALAFGGSLIIGSAGVYAQEAQKQERIEVTGSNIKRSDTETASPVIVITKEEIQKSGKQSVADVIRSLNIDSNGSIPQSFSNGFAAGASGVSIRGLGVNSTLVLLNGRRMAPYGLADDGQRSFVDLSSIPLDVVERVEVVKDGASSIYGSDAIAAVVNIILRKDYTGVTASAGFGTSRYNDGTVTKASINGGFGDRAKDGYNFFLSLEAMKQGEIKTSDRADRNYIGAADIRPLGYGLTEGRIRGYRNPTGSAIEGLAAGATSASPTGWARPVAGPESTRATGAYRQLGGGACSPVAAYNGSLPTGLIGCTWDFGQFTELQPKEQKLNLFGRGTFDINSNLQAFVEAGVFNSKVKTNGTPTSVSGQWYDAPNATFRDNTFITMGPAHPDNPTPGSYARLRYITGDAGGRTGDYNTTVGRFLTGLKGTAWDWDYETGFLYTESKTDITKNGYARDSVLRDYLNGTNLSGQNPTSSYYRLGVNAGLNSSSTYSAIFPSLKNVAKNSITSIDFKASRELMQLSGGSLGLATGLEVRQEKSNSPPTPYTDVADIIGLGYSGFSGSRNVSAVYAELNAPVLKSLELTAAVRNDHYSDYGNSFTPKVGAKWTPIKEFVVRATYAEGFRAPGPAESGKSVGGSAGYTSYVDPVRCPVLGLPADCGSGTTLLVSAANPIVKPEKSKSTTLGFIFEPGQNTSIGIDFWHIKRSNEILGADAAAVLNNPAGFPTAVILRDSTDNLSPPDVPVTIPNSGTVLSISAPYTNGPNTTTSGFDIDARQKFILGEYGKLNLGLTWSYVHQFKRTLPDGTVSEYSGTYGPTALSSSSGMPRNRGVLGVDWEKGPWNLATRINYVGGMKNVESQEDPNGCLTHFADGTEAPSGCRTKAFTTVDVSTKYQVTKELQVYGSIQNLFDAVAPIDLSAYYGATRFNATYHLSGGIGRYYQLGIKYQWR